MVVRMLRIRVIVRILVHVKKSVVVASGQRIARLSKLTYIILIVQASSSTVAGLHPLVHKVSVSSCCLISVLVQVSMFVIEFSFRFVSVFLMDSFLSVRMYIGARAECCLFIFQRCPSSKL